MHPFLLLPDGRRVPAKDNLTMGRLPSCDVVLTDTKASRKHARLHLEGSVVEVEDLDSHNGTLLNGKPVQRRVLRDGDQIQIGTTTIVFRETESAGAGAAPARAVPPGGPLAATPRPSSPPPAAADASDADLGGVDLTAELGGVDLTDELAGGPVPAAPPPAAPRVASPPSAPSPRPPPLSPPPAPSHAPPPAQPPFGGPEELVQPRQRSAEPTPPVPSPRSAADRSGAGGDRNADKGGDFDVVEFADEVVQVRRREVKPTSSGPGSSGGGRPAVGAATRTARVEHGVLQFSRQATSSTVATDDLRQMPAALRLLLVVLAVAIAIGLGWLAMVLAR